MKKPEIENSIEIFERLKINIAVLRKAILEEATDPKPKSQRTYKFLTEAFKFNEKILGLIDAEIEILELDKAFYEMKIRINPSRV